jgi:hypothetical protein
MPQSYFDPRSLGAPLPGSPAGPPPTGVTPGVPMSGQQFGSALGFPPPEAAGQYPAYNIGRASTQLYPDVNAQLSVPALSEVPPPPTATPSPTPTGAPTPTPVNGADMLSTFAFVPQTPITPPQSPYSPRTVAQSGELNDMLNQSPETRFLGKPTPPPSPTPAPIKKSNQYAV